MTTSNFLRRLAVMATALSGLVSAPAVLAAGPSVALDTFPATKVNDVAALQNGAKVFMNYCLGCHSISQVRYNKLRDLGLNEEQIKGSLMLTQAKFGDPILTT
ncbi:MAG TPA: cytochrome c1, partial [Burkholderiaceae bacterium]|nr:cytochrome c1 [Burkholderiaceae bacterium]